MEPSQQRIHLAGISSPTSFSGEVSKEGTGHAKPDSSSPQLLEFTAGILERLTQRFHPRVSQVVVYQTDLYEALLCADEFGEICTASACEITVP